MKRIGFFCITLLLSLAVLGQGRWDNIKELPANHPLLVKADSLASKIFLTDYWERAILTGQALQVLHQAYGCYPINSYEDAAQLRKSKRTDRQRLADICETVFRLPDVSASFLLSDTKESPQAQALMQHLKDGGVVRVNYTPKELSDFAKNNSFELKDSTEKSLYKQSIGSNDSAWSAALQLIELLKQRRGEKEPTRLIFQCKMARLHMAKHMEQCIALYREVADLYRKSGQKLGYKLAMMDLCEGLNSQAEYAVESVSGIWNWQKADSIKALEIQLLGEALGEDNPRTRRAMLERDLMPVKEQALYAESNHDPLRYSFMNGVRLFRSGDYAGALAVFQQCDAQEKRSNDRNVSRKKRMLRIRNSYLRQWMAHCEWQLDPKALMERMQRQGGVALLQPPLDRSLTLEMDCIEAHSPKFTNDLSRYLEAAQEAFGEGSPEYAHVLMIVSKTSELKSTQIFDYINQALKIYAETLGKESISYAYALTCLGDLLGYAGDVKTRARYLEEVLPVYEKTFGVTHKDYQDMLFATIDAMKKCNRHDKAAKYLHLRLENELFSEYCSKGDVLKDLAKETDLQNDTIDGKCSAERAADIIEEGLTNDTSLNTSAMQFALISYLMKSGKKERAVRILQAHIDSPLANRNYYLELIKIYYSQKDYQEAIEMAEKMQEYCQKSDSMWINDYLVASVKSKCLERMGKPEEAMQCWQWCLEQRDKHKKRLRVSDLFSYAKVLNRLNRVEEGARAMRKGTEEELRFLLSFIVTMSETEREQYWNRDGRKLEEDMALFTYQNKHKVSIEELYDVCLLSKGLLLNLEMEIERAFRDLDDTNGMNIYHQLRQDRINLAGQMERPQIYRTMDTDSLMRQIKLREKDLRGRFRYQKSDGVIARLRTRWPEVRDKLGRTDVAVEFITVPITRNNTLYVALTLRANDDTPHMTPLFDQRQLDSLRTEDYYTADGLYRLVWQPLVQELAGMKRIFFAPAGRLHQIGIEHLPGMEAFECYRLSSTRQLIQPSQQASTIDAILYGGLQYELSDEETAAVHSTRGQNAETSFRERPDLRTYRGADAGLPVLEGSKKEVEDIGTLMRELRLSSQTFMGLQGTEDRFKALSGKGKTLIHISTHGFYAPSSPVKQKPSDELSLEIATETTEEDQSLSRSGVLLTGAANYLDQEPELPWDEDGILTAREIARLNLQGLQLVTLSACETGLGDITGDGVFGLQRGFKKAGAQSILMSLWKVDDEATCLLMTEFYKNWIGKNMTKHDALEKAKQTVRSHKEKGWDDPKYWAAFILLDALD